MFIRLFRFATRASIAASLFTVADLHAGPPCPVQPVPIYQTPYGYYPTQWRPYPMFGEQLPPIAIVFPSETVPMPKKNTPEHPPIVVPMKMGPKVVEPVPAPKVIEPVPEPKKMSLSYPLSSPYNQMILPPDYVPGDKSFARGVRPIAVMPDTSTPKIGPEIKILLPNPTIDLLKDAGEEATEIKAPSQPKAWLELPIPVPTPTIRGSSHQIGEKPRWESATRK